MTTLTWLFFLLSLILGFFISWKIRGGITNSKARKCLRTMRSYKTKDDAIQAFQSKFKLDKY